MSHYWYDNKERKKTQTWNLKRRRETTWEINKHTCRWSGIEMKYVLQVYFMKWDKLCPLKNTDHHHQDHHEGH